MSRLPIVGSDSGTWGTVLNDYLQVGHTSSGKHQFVYNVMEYGAVGNGTTDDAAAIQAAIDAAEASTRGVGVVVFPPPSSFYGVSQSLEVDSDGIALVGAGGEGEVIIGPLSTADPTYTLRVGVTKNVYACHLFGLTFAGRNDSSTSGGGVRWNVNNGSIKQVVISDFGGVGLYVDSYDSSVNYGTYGEDVYLRKNGMNTSTPGDNLYIGPHQSDSAWHRVTVYGGQQETTPVGRHGIYNQGSAARFSLCHVYCCVDGFHEDATGLGGPPVRPTLENCLFRDNEQYNVSIDGAENVLLLGTRCYGTPESDAYIHDCPKTQLSDCAFTSDSDYENVVLSGSGDSFLVQGCLFTNTTTLAPPIQVYGPDNGVIDSCLFNADGGPLIKSAHVVFSHNVVHNQLVEADPADYNVYDGNLFLDSAPSFYGAHSVACGNQGFNPAGILGPPSIPDSDTPYTNAYRVPCTVIVSGGTVSDIAVDSASLGVTSGTVRVGPGSTITLTYSSAPSWVWYGD